MNGLEIFVNLKMCSRRYNTLGRIDFLEISETQPVDDGCFVGIR